jgi:hypothetical protein
MNQATLKGRSPGSKNKVTLELFKIAKERGYKHPVLYLIEVVNDEKAAPERRDTCAIAAAPCMTLKFGTAAPARYLEEPVQVPDFQTVGQAEAYLASIPVLLGKGEIDSQSALELSTLTKNWLDAIYARQDYELKLAGQGGGSDTTIRLTGGLPPLPGCRIVVDLGLPLDAVEADPALVPQISGLREHDPSLLAIVLSHGHRDHWGLFQRFAPTSQS